MMKATPWIYSLLMLTACRDPHPDQALKTSPDRHRPILIDADYPALPLSPLSTRF